MDGILTKIRETQTYKVGKYRKGKISFNTYWLAFFRFKRMCLFSQMWSINNLLHKRVIKRNRGWDREIERGLEKWREFHRPRGCGPIFKKPVSRHWFYTKIKQSIVMKTKRLVCTQDQEGNDTPLLSGPILLKWPLALYCWNRLQKVPCIR